MGLEMLDERGCCDGVEHNVLALLLALRALNQGGFSCVLSFSKIASLAIRSASKFYH